MSSTMTKDEREAFLADLHVGILGINVEGRAPAMVPIWYSYEPGAEVVFITNKGAKKIDLLKKAGRFSLCVQDEQPPYSFVSVEGTVISIKKANHQRDLTPLAQRYLGVEKGNKYVRDSQGDSEVLVRMRPERWTSADYGKS
ncbi:pyridoxamine 5'-phosphate oxidase family protein [Chloroflexota bacterium]